LVPVLGRPGGGSALWRLADGWKSELRATTAQEASYLQVALLEWEKGHNRHPDLSGLVEVHVEEGQGTTLLSAAQVDRLRRFLDDLSPEGRVRIRLLEPGGPQLPGQRLALDVNGTTVSLPADRQAAIPPFDPCFLGYFYVFWLQIGSLMPNNGRNPPAVVAAGAGVCVAAGAFSHRLVVARRERASGGVIAVGIVAALALTAFSHFIRSPLTIEGEPILGFGPGLLVLSFIAGYYSWSLGRRQWATFAAMAGVVLLGLWMFPLPAALNMRTMVGAVAYNVFPYFPLRHLASALHRAAAQHAEDIEAVDQGAERAAFLSGRESVVGLVRQAREDALRQLDAVRPTLDPLLAELATHRLEEVEQRLRSIEPAGGSSSSTTTS
jgi:hypothetical protein